MRRQTHRQTHHQTFGLLHTRNYNPASRIILVSSTFIKNISMSDSTNTASSTVSDSAPPSIPVMEPRLWHDDGWEARVIKNEDDDGWAVAMTKDGEPEPGLVVPWTMGRDKKNPKPLDVAAFHVLLRAAREIRMRHEHQLQATLHKKVVVRVGVGEGDGDVVVTLDLVPDEEAPYATLTARTGRDRVSPPLAEVRVSASFKLTDATALAWIENDFAKPG